MKIKNGRFGGEAVGTARTIAKTMVLKDGVSGTLNRIGAGTVRYKKQLADLKAQGVATWSSLKSGVASAAAGIAASLAGIAGVKATLGGGIEAAAELESYRGTLNTVLKDTKKAGLMMQWASGFALITPFDPAEVVEGTVRLESYGIQATKTMKQIGDMAAVMNKDLMQAIEAVADAQTGELERLKEFGITKAMIEKKSGEMFKGQTIINNQGQIVEMKKFNQALFALMEDRFKGGMEQQAKTYRGAMANLSGTWKQALAEMAGATASGEVREGSLLDKLKEGAVTLTATLTQMAESGALQRIGDRLADIFSKTVATGKWIKDHWGGISSVILAVAGAWGAYKLAVTAAAGAQQVLNVAMGANPIGLLIKGIALLIGYGIWLWKNWDRLETKWRILGTVFGGGIGVMVAAGKFLVDNWRNVETGLALVWNSIIGTVESSVNAVIGGVRHMINNVIDTINDFINTANKVNPFSPIDTINNLPTGPGTWKSGMKFDTGGVTWSNMKWDEWKNPFTSKKQSAEESWAPEKKDTTLSELEQMIDALNKQTAATIDAAGATKANTKATKANTKAQQLKDNGTPTDIADSLFARIERHMYST